MYIKLGSTKINYYQTQDDFMIFSEVVDSGISFEKPIIVRTVNELDIWFGNNFSSYGYLKELLRNNVSLYLYRPISSEQNIYDDNYIDYDNFQVDPVLYYRSQDLPYPGKTSTQYKLVNNLSGKYIDQEAGLKFDLLIWYLSEYINVDELPQNLINNTESLNNRDTLTLTYSGYDGPEYYYPKYFNETKEVIYTEILNEEGITNNTGLSWKEVVDKINLGYYSLAFDINFRNNFLNHTGNQYIILEDQNGKNVLVYFCDKLEDNIPSEISDKYYSSTRKIIKSESPAEKLLNIFKEFGYQVEKKNNEEYLVYTSIITKSTYFNNLVGFDMMPNFRVTHNLISKYCNNSSRLNFTSKLIGSEEDEDRLISITVEEIKNNRYRVTIEKYNYSEVFEGSISNNFGDDRIDFKITNESKLVSCNIIETYINVQGKEVNYSSITSERSKNLPTGTWKLRGGVQEKYTPEMYWNAVDCIFNDGDTVFFDYFLVPNRKLYTTELSNDFNYFLEYTKFLEYAKLIECQVLIQNNDNHWKHVIVNPEEDIIPEENIVYVYPDNKYMAIINEVYQETTDREIIENYKGDYIFNYIQDIDNRLIYFYRTIEINGYTRPGYYLFISGLLNNVFSASGNYITYQSPVKNPYDNENIEIELEKYKSNYLVDNNQIYYYKNYQNGENPNTTGWMRFCIGKVTRELEKNKWEYLALRDVGIIKRKITGTIERIAKSFSIIRRIDITNFSFIFQENKLELSIDIEISDLVNNNLSLDITLNYNKQD